MVVTAAVSIRTVDDTVRERRRARAAAHDRSTEAGMGAILVEAVRPRVFAHGHHELRTTAITVAEIVDHRDRPEVPSNGSDAAHVI
jgi:plasmid stability protein